MKVEYLEDGDLAIFDGIKFRRDKKTGYFLNSNIQKRLHIYVWEYNNGNIPKGYEIHHKDHDKNNNEIDNLDMLTKKEHMKIHSKELTKEQREWYKNNLSEKARPKAIEWHKSKKGREWHKKHYEEMKDKLKIREPKVCECCGEYFIAKTINSRFCSNKCKSKWRRDNHLDDIERKCEICGKIFITNRYSKTKTCGPECVLKLKKNNKIVLD